MFSRLIAALWFGSGCFLILAASAAFRAAGDPTVAANVVESLLTRWHYIALLAPLLLFALELRRVRRLVLIVLFVAILLAALQSFVDLRIRAIRAESPMAISSLPRTDPVRRNFGKLHGLSSLLLLLQTVGAAVAVTASAKERLVDQVDQYEVVVNDEEQYSIWPVGRDLPPGWRPIGFRGTKEQALTKIKEIWTDMRPHSRRAGLLGATEDTTQATTAEMPEGQRYVPVESPEGLRTIMPADQIPANWRILTPDLVSLDTLWN
jgi:MbtH protein